MSGTLPRAIVEPLCIGVVGVLIPHKVYRGRTTIITTRIVTIQTNGFGGFITFTHVQYLILGVLDRLFFSGVVSHPLIVA